MNKYPDYIMKAARQSRFDLDEDDTSRDEEIMKADPSWVLRWWLNWEGIIGYTGTIIEAIEDIYHCDLTAREFYEEV